MLQNLIRRGAALAQSSQGTSSAVMCSAGSPRVDTASFLQHSFSHSAGSFKVTVLVATW